MKEWQIWTLGIIGAIIAVILAGFVFGWLDVALLETFGLKKANIKREIFEESKSYVHGKIQDLSDYKRQYDKAMNEDKPDEAEAIAMLIRSQMADLDAPNIKNNELRGFLVRIRGY